jgi:hypothetical protein
MSSYEPRLFEAICGPQTAVLRLVLDGNVSGSKIGRLLVRSCQIRQASGNKYAARPARSLLDDALHELLVACGLLVGIGDQRAELP